MTDTGAVFIGIDVGGTFTDLVAVSRDDGRVRADKVLSTPRDQSEGVAAVVAPFATAAVARVAHGTTVVTNMLLERRGARVVLCATQGATDLLILRRQERASLYDLAVHHPSPLVAPADVIPVRERVEPQGVTVSLTPDECDRVAAATAAQRPAIVAIALLHAYDNATHEEQLQEAIQRALPDVDVVRSSDVLPEIREYERTATTTCEAYARPGVASYLRRLEDRLGVLGLPAPAVMTSNGGMLSAEDAASRAAALALSGPAGGVAGAALVLRAAGLTNGLTIDIGGTSADAGIILDGEPLVESGGSVAGVPIALPRVLVETVSAGGGSIGWVDDGGALRVGPRSAGAVPGPVAFGRGGTEPTLTDAHLALGNIQADRMRADVPLDRSAAHQAVARLAATLSERQQSGVSPERCARAMIATADATMARALRRVSVERGVDPRDCTLVAFGGAGPLHACGLADLLGMHRILVPPHAGVLSALGLAVAPERRTGLASVMRLATDDEMASVRAAAALADARTGALGVGDPIWVARMRYLGQGHELEVPFQPEASARALNESFAARHGQRFRFVLEAAIEVVSVRCTRSVPGPGLTLARRRSGRNPWSADVPQDDAGPLDQAVRGPRVVALPDATMLIADGWTARPLAIGGWLLERTPARP